jgi:SAM-dependent methyltransferase
MEKLLGILSHSSADLARDAAELESLGVPGTGYSIVPLLGNSRTFFCAQSVGDSGHYLSPLPSDYFEFLMIGRSVRLFACAWSVTLLSHLLRAVVTGGAVFVPVFPAAEAANKGYWSVTLLSRFFDVESLEAATPYVRLRRQIGSPPASTLLWFLETTRGGNVPASVTRDEMRQRLRLEHHLRPITLPGRYARQLPIENTRDSVLGPAEAISQSLYYIQSVHAKSALVDYILQSELPRKRDLKICDQGGAYGGVCVELMLKNPGIRKGVCVDVSFGHQLIARDLYSRFSDALRGRFFFERQSFDQFEYDDRYDLVSFIGGTLLLVSRERAATAIRRAWNALAPGGILVVQEHIKHPRFERDFEVMYSVEELDSLLGSLGPIAYYMSTAAKAISKDKAATKTVYRVVKKA